MAKAADSIAAEVSRPDAAFLPCICGEPGVFGGLCGEHVRFRSWEVKGFPVVGEKFVRCVMRGLDEPKESDAFLRLYRESALGNEDLVRVVKEREKL
jgi:hypothetical protein